MRPNRLRPWRPGLFGIAEPRPVAGDIVVQSAEDCPTDYVLSPDPAPAQIRCAAYGTALTIARQWARQTHVDVWFADRDAFALLTRCRDDSDLMA